MGHGCPETHARKRDGKGGPICLVLNKARCGALYSRRDIYNKYSTERQVS
jgi:hypothetical protein